MLSEFTKFADEESVLEFVQVPFNHPLYIMYSSGTTGPPKCMVHSVGVSKKIANIIKLLPGKNNYSPLRRYWNWLGFCKPKNLNKYLKIFRNSKRGDGVLEKTSSMGEVWICSGTTQCIF